VTLSRAALAVVLVGVVGAGTVGRKVVHRVRRWRHQQALAATAREAPPAGPSWTPPALAIPREHPRLWWTPERLAREKAWAKRTGGLHPRDDDHEGLALAYLVEGDRKRGRQAVDWLLGLTFDTSGTACDQARWSGEEAMLVYDWCHDLLTPAERQLLIERWNGYLDALNKKSWGGAGMEGNNYYWGYTRNDIEWGIASAYENPRAAALLEEGLRTRFGRSFVPFAAGPGRGGVLGEGTQYGQYLLGYAAVPFVTAANEGVDLWDASNFFQEAIYYLIYATTPAPTTTVGGGQRRFELFPFDDDEKFHDGGSAEGADLTLYMIPAAAHWRAAPVGGYARAWLDLVKPQMFPLVAELAAAPSATPRPFSELPLDYFAPGPQFLYARSRWGGAGPVVQLQLGLAPGAGHQHVDWGTFQLWRGGRWLTRETVGYGEPIAGWGGGPAGTVGSDGALGHNTILFEGMGARNADNRRGPPHLLRLESRPGYAYAAVDLSDSYRCLPGECHPERDENPYAKTIVREFIYLRGLETLLVFDRLEADDDRKPAAEVTKTFVLHTETQPAVETGNRLLISNGAEALRVFTLVPAAVTPRVVTEGGKVGQFRVELDARGPAQGYFLNVLQARGKDEPDLKVALQEGPDSFTVRLAHPTRGAAVVVLDKGMASRGGAVGLSSAPSAALPAPAPLGTGVQAMTVTEQGPRWQ
jgi:hypothetical protein